VEICPWCDGQLSRCNCRFEQLAVEEIDSEQQLETLTELLLDKGRVPFRRHHAPYYPGAGQNQEEAEE
jgi:hypothetical protein